MTLRICTPVPLDQLVALMTLHPPVKPRARHVLQSAAILQGARSETIGFYEEVVEQDGRKRPGALVAAVTLYPLDPEIVGEDLRELSFACRPQAAAHLTGIIHHARLTRTHLAQDARLRIRATVAKGHEPGRRLARLIGLRLAGECGTFELWEWCPADEGEHEQGGGERQKSCHRRRKRRAAALT